MQRINKSTTDVRDIVNALEGDYDCGRMRNGIAYLMNGKFIHFSGYFDGSQKVVEIPKIPVKAPVMFLGDDFGCASVVEANSGFVKVPEAVQGKKFVVLCDCVLNV